MDRTIFACTKEAAIWGILYGFQQEEIDFRVTYCKDIESKEMETLLFRWHRNNPPKIDESMLSCTLVFNTVPRYIEIPYDMIAAIVADGGVAVAFPIEPPDATGEGEVHEPEKKPHLKLVN